MFEEKDHRKFWLAFFIMCISGLSVWFVLSPSPVIDEVNEQQDVRPVEIPFDDVIVEPVEESEEITVEDSNEDEQEQVIVEDTANILDCIDCIYAPIDKENRLPSTYNPGGIIPDAQAAYSQLVSAASSAGIEIELISGFRSYEEQNNVFNSWVTSEQSSGKTYQQAVDDANEYSAKPGHSEHQLGTTFDVKCAGCAAFDFDDNADLNQFIEDNAHLYGFVVSYPKNSEGLTGYTYEPWHIRWIGEELALELYNTGYPEGNGNYLSKFLTEKGY